MNFIKIFFYFMSPFFLFLIILLRTLIKIRIGVLTSERIGHFAWDTELYLSQKIIHKDSFFDLFCFTDIVSNKYLAKKWKNHLIILPNYILFPIIRLNRFLSKYLKFLEIHNINLQHFDPYGEVFKTKIKIKFNKLEILKAENLLIKNGIDSKKIVCLIVRDSKYLKVQFPSKDFSYHNYRDCNIDNYIDTVKYLNQKGYTVIRMGRVVKKKMKYRNSLYIEYAGSKIESDFMDIYLGYKCLFTITSGTGWEAIPAFLFRKPMVFTNFAPFVQLITTNNKFINLSKRYYSNKLKKYLTVSEIFKFCASDIESFNKKKIIPKENTPTELKNATIEMINKIVNKQKYSKKEDYLNKQFWKSYRENLSDERGNQLTWDGIKCHGNKFKSRYSIYFLKKNKNFIK